MKYLFTPQPSKRSSKQNDHKIRIGIVAPLEGRVGPLLIDAGELHGYVSHFRRSTEPIQRFRSPPQQQPSKPILCPQDVHLHKKKKIIEITRESEEKKHKKKKKGTRQRPTFRPKPANQLPPRRRMVGATATVSTLVTVVGHPNTPTLAGNGGFRRGLPWRPCENSHIINGRGGGGQERETTCADEEWFKLRLVREFATRVALGGGRIPR